MYWPLIIICILGAAGGIPVDIMRRWSLAPILSRPYSDQEWRLSFPDAPQAEIDKFLKLFADGFSLRSKHYLRFYPSDRIMDVYRAINPPQWTFGDSCEFEIFGLVLKRRYGFTLKSMWRDDLTLADIFSRTRTV